MRAKFRSICRSRRREEAHAFRRGSQSLLMSAATIALLVCGFADASDEFASFVQPLLAKHCIKCHGGEKVKGKVNLKEIDSATQFLTKAELIKEMVEVIDARDMPPEDEPQLDENDRTKLLSFLKQFLHQAASSAKNKPDPIRRLNRFQYNNAIRDLFQLDRNVFHLQEKLMTRQTDYLTDHNGVMPDKVDVACLSLTQRKGMQWVEAFPKDLRATHGFDNQANQLTLSPLLLDSFLQLSVSILESPDFNEQTVGNWNDYFKAPANDHDRTKSVRGRLSRFLTLAFRRPVERATLDRYVAYARAKLKDGHSFTDSMKKVFSAALSSPNFLYRSSADLNLASRLSFFLWGSGPDQELLDLVSKNQLSQPKVLEDTIDRMLADPKIERFLDSFPSQWMQLENVLGANPDRAKARYFHLMRSYRDNERPASTQMVLEPLLLFDAVFIENRPITELIAPAFSYQSEFLRNWYARKIALPSFNAEEFAQEVEANEKRRTELQAIIAAKQKEMKALIPPAAEARKKLLAAIKATQQRINKISKITDPKREQVRRAREYENVVRRQLLANAFERIPANDLRYGGIITSAATLTMTSGTKRTQPISRGAWVIEVILNDPPPPPPNDVPPLDENAGPKNLTIREKFAQHREHPDCAGCHARIDPLGFALENFDLVGLWRDQYENGRDVDVSGTLLRKHDFSDVVSFKEALVKEDRRFAKAFTAHLLRFALARELTPADTLAIDGIVAQTAPEKFRLRSLIREVILSNPFRKIETNLASPGN